MKSRLRGCPSSHPPQPTKATSQPEPSNKKLAFSSGGPSQVDKDEEFLALLHQLPEKAGLSAAFIDRFTSEEG
ncbi:LOW QUALITY PROTEIN: hypothetical protein PanWU01x14_080810 [Parasponia andersonii]|uniref:Uncharacterized protein n=1 Tax=Parasponia andersonii TaxID=3476 RepID=A0A2P5DAW0_PARAD|nr:LOW QUALITY PROTEIN: hypothetical protein PanWU01x14_080810 [Parasponia andersonii]